uniref:C-type lectin domain-containing protein n=1 Tax=Panagrolaimus davidi TaxID=227884 RepID=A0A914Q5D5_9BILA
MFLSQEAALAFHDSTETNFWIGGTNELIPGNWSWIDGTPFNYADWMKGQPENVSTSNCATSSFTNSLWTAEDCFKNKSFVCLIPSMTVTTTTIRSTTHKPYKCEDGWTLFESSGFCYKAFTNMNMTWQDSEDFCITNNSAHLTSIHSKEENDFIADLARQAIPRSRVDCGYYQSWIGLFTVTENEIWLWSDNTTIDYLGWSSGEPNFPGLENCVQLMLHDKCFADTINLWNNESCSFIVQNVVCKKPHEK